MQGTRAVGGVALSHLPGLGTVAGAAMGIGAMTVAMLRLPFTAVLLATLRAVGARDVHLEFTEHQDSYGVILFFRKPAGPCES